MPKYYYLQLIRKRLAWILMYEKVRSVTMVCRYFGISRKCFYKWQGRYRASGNDANSLLDRSRRPMSSPRLTSKHIQSLIVRLRKATNPPEADFQLRP